MKFTNLNQFFPQSPPVCSIHKKGQLEIMRTLNKEMSSGENAIFEIIVAVMVSAILVVGFVAAI